MSKPNMWCGYLEAGGKSTPVLRDNSLETGNPKTIYLFNLHKGQILEYDATIVEPKLRELNGGESKIASSLKTTYKKVRADFKPRGAKLTVTARTKSTANISDKLAEEDVIDIGEDDTDDFDDTDIDDSDSDD